MTLNISCMSSRCASLVIASTSLTRTAETVGATADDDASSNGPQELIRQLGTVVKTFPGTSEAQTVPGTSSTISKVVGAAQPSSGIDE